MDLKAVKTTREISIGIFYIAYRRKCKGRVICLNILIKAIGLWIITLK
jgi:multisubunit Na+/H+ antiporter MnhC subunit